MSSSGNLLSLEKPETMRVSRDFRPQILFGRFLRCLHFLRFSNTRPFRLRIELGSSLIDVPSKRSFSKCFITSVIIGNLFSFEQPKKMRVLRVL